MDRGARAGQSVRAGVFALRRLPGGRDGAHRQRRAVVCDHHGPSHRAWRAGAEVSGLAAPRDGLAAGGQAHRAIHAGLLDPHPDAQRPGQRRGALLRAQATQRPFTGALRGRAEDAGHGVAGSRRARRRRGADAPPRLRVLGPHRGPDHGAAHRDGGAGRGHAGGRGRRDRRARRPRAVADLPQEHRRHHRHPQHHGPVPPGGQGAAPCRSVRGRPRRLHGARDPDRRRFAVGDAPAGIGDCDRHRRVRRHRWSGDVCRPDGTHRRRTWRRRADHRYSPTARRSSTGWRWWPTSTRSSACTSTRSRTTRWAGTCWDGWDGAHASAIDSMSKAARFVSRRWMDCGSHASTCRRRRRTALRRPEQSQSVCDDDQ